MASAAVRTRGQPSVEDVPRLVNQLQQGSNESTVIRRPGRTWCKVADAMVKFYEAEARGAKLREGLRPIEEEISDPFRLAAATSDADLDAINARRTEGDHRYLKILKILDSFEGVERHENQKLWHWWMIVACLRHIYGLDWQNASTRVLRSLGLSEIRTEILVMTPRRFGKTWSVAMIVCALLLSVPGFRIAVISPGSRTSGKMLEEIKRMMGRLRGADRHICGMDKTKMFVSTEPLPVGTSIKSELARRMCTLPSTSVIEVLPDNPDGTLACSEASQFTSNVMAAAAAPTTSIVRQIAAAIQKRSSPISFSKRSCAT